MRHGAEGVDKRGVLGEVPIEGPPLLVGCSLAQGPDNDPDFVFCDIKSRLVNMYPKRKESCSQLSVRGSWGEEKDHLPGFSIVLDAAAQSVIDDITGQFDCKKSTVPIEEKKSQVESDLKSTSTLPRGSSSAHSFLVRESRNHCLECLA